MDKIAFHAGSVKEVEQFLQTSGVLETICVNKQSKSCYRHVSVIPIMLIPVINPVRNNG
jgi:hypothetical protein